MKVKRYKSLKEQSKIKNPYQIKVRRYHCRNGICKKWQKV